MRKIRVKTTGQTGTLVRKAQTVNIIDLDGYEAERASAEEFKSKFGEAPNMVPWMVLLSDEEIEVIE
jgi:hypothetical protein